MDFVVLDTEPVVVGANYVPIILRRPFLATSNAIINCRKWSYVADIWEYDTGTQYFPAVQEAHAPSGGPRRSLFD